MERDRVHRSLPPMVGAHERDHAVQSGQQSCIETTPRSLSPRLMKPKLRLSLALILCGGCVVTTALASNIVEPIEIVVAFDGSGQFKTIQEAVMSVPAGTPRKPVIIRIKPGTYKELIYVQREKRFFKFVGEDPSKTI